MQKLDTLKNEKVTAKALLKLIEAQSHKCALSGVDLTPENASLDHIVPLSAGGLNVMANVQVLDAKVNQAKGTMSQNEFLALCRAVVEYADNPES